MPQSVQVIFYPIGYETHKTKPLKATNRSERQGRLGEALAGTGNALRIAAAALPMAAEAK